MSSLKEMINFLILTKKDLEKIIEKLDKIQLVFNDNFSNVNRLRNSEIEFLQEEFFKSREKFPRQVLDFYDEQLGAQEALFKKNLGNLREKKKEINDRMKKEDENRKKLFRKIKSSNRKLDNKEENLKKEISDNEAGIEKFNSRIDELDNGFGLIINLFKMKKIQQEKEKLIENRDVFIENIELIREKWVKASEKYAEEEKGILDNWNTVKTDQSILIEKIKLLEENKQDIVKKAAFIGALNKLRGFEKFLNSGNKNKYIGRCSRCGSDNKLNIYFCFYCGERFSKDKKDIAGSLTEIGELNRVHERLLPGIKKSVSFLALLKGIKKGMTEFVKSVESVKSSQEQYSSLPKLRIDVPEFSRKLSAKISELESKTDVKFYNIHPVEFSDSFSEYEKEIFTDKNIEDFFGKMGNELNSTTDKQWG